MSTSEKIRALALEGLTTAEIARRLNIRYQHAYKVLKDANKQVPKKSKTTTTIVVDPPISKLPLAVQELERGGFEFSGRWVLGADNSLMSDRSLPKAVGVYAFAREGVVLYVGVATMGLSKRLYFYGKPGSTQRTSQRIHAELREALKVVPYIDIYTACPPDLEWNGLPIHGSAGLELGLIKKYSLPWNVRGASR
jgi:hypothetical protein